MASSSTSVGYIDEHGNYVRGDDKPMPNERSGMYKQYAHDLGRKEYAGEIIQPHVNGQPNPKFIEAYPEYSHKYWDQQTIDKALREPV